MHNIYIRARKDPVQQWTKQPFVATNNAIFTVLEAWPPEWHAPDLFKLEKVATQKWKQKSKLCITQLAERWKNEKAAVEVREVCEVTQKPVEQKKAAKVAAAMQTTAEAIEEVQATSLG